MIIKYKILFMILISIILTGCFDKEDVVIKGLRGASINVNGTKVDTVDVEGTTISLLPGSYVISLYKQDSEDWYYYGEKKIVVHKGEDTQVSIDTVKLPTQAQLNRLKKKREAEAKKYLQEKQELEKKLSLGELMLKNVDVEDIVKYGLLKKENLPGDIVQNIQAKYPIYDLAMSIDGKTVVSIGGRPYAGNEMISIDKVDTPSKAVHHTSYGSGGIGDTIVISPDAKHILIGLDTGWGITVKHINLARKPIKNTRGMNWHKSKRARVMQMAITSDSKYVLSAGDDGTLVYWDLNKEKKLRVFKRHPHYDVRTVAISPDGKYALSGDRRGNLIYWNIKTGKKRKLIKAHKMAINKVAFTSDGKFALTASEDKTIVLWNIKTAKKVKVLSGHTSSVNDIVVSKDNKYVLSGSDDRTLRYWDLEKGTTILVLKGHKDEIFAVALTHDRKHAVSISRDKTLKIWNFNIAMIDKIPEIKEYIEKEGYKKYPFNSIKTFDTSYKFFGNPYELKNKISKFLEKKYNLAIRSTFKKGEIGERYVPYTSSSYYTSDTETTYINGHAYIQSKSHRNDNSSGGYREKIEGYKAIYEVKNRSDKYYILEFNATWNGKYSKYVTKKYSFWSSNSGTYSQLLSEWLNSNYPFGMVIAPNEKIKYQFEVGEEEPKELVNMITSAREITKDDYQNLKIAISDDCEDMRLINNLLSKEEFVKWHGILNQKKEKIFSKRYKDKVAISFKYDKKEYDSDFSNEIVMYIKVPQKMLVHYKTDFGKDETVIVDRSFTKKYELKGVEVQKLKGDVVKVWPLDSEYTKRYRELLGKQKVQKYIMDVIENGSNHQIMQNNTPMPDKKAIFNKDKLISDTEIRLVSEYIANGMKGKNDIYLNACAVCHGKDGKGIKHVGTNVHSLKGI